MGHQVIGSHMGAVVLEGPSLGVIFDSFGNKDTRKMVLGSQSEQMRFQISRVIDFRSFDLPRSSFGFPLSVHFRNHYLRLLQRSNLVKAEMTHLCHDP